MAPRGYRCLQSPKEGIGVTVLTWVLGTDLGSSVDTLWNPNC